MLLHAAEYHEAAEPAYLNAQDLMPGDVRWPYYLGHLYKSIGQTQKSIDAFTRALDRSPSEIATLVWLGRLYLEQGKPDEAEQFFTRAARSAAAQRRRALRPRSGGARPARLHESGVGARGSAGPRSERGQHPFAAGQRVSRSGRRGARPKRISSSGGTPRSSCPIGCGWISTCRSRADSSYELRGVRALEARDFKAAEGFFRKGVELTPTTTALGRSLRHKLGTALILQGDVPGAMARFEEVAKLAPAEGLDEASAKANYSLGVVMASSSRLNEAVQRLSAAVKYNPNYAEALMALGDTLRRMGRFEASLKPYADVVRINPRAADARFGYAMALVRLRRYRDARDWLARALACSPIGPSSPTRWRGCWPRRRTTACATGRGRWRSSRS